MFHHSNVDELQKATTNISNGCLAPVGNGEIPGPKPEHQANQKRSRCQLKRQKRTNFSSHQRYELEMAFKHSQYLTPKTSRKLEKLGIPDEKIKVWFKNRRVKWRKEIRDWCSSKTKNFAACKSYSYDHNEVPEAFPPHDSDQAIAAEHRMTINTHTRSPAVVPHTSLFVNSCERTVLYKNASTTPDAFNNEASVTQGTARLLGDTSVHNGNKWLYAGNSSVQNGAQFANHSESKPLYSSAMQWWTTSSGANVMRDSSVICNANTTRDASVINGTPWLPDKNPTVQVQPCDQARSLSRERGNGVINGNSWLSGETSSSSQTFTHFSSPTGVRAFPLGVSVMPHSATIHAIMNESRWLSRANASLSQNRTPFQGLSKLHCGGAFRATGLLGETQHVVHAPWTQAIPDMRGSFNLTNAGDQIVPENSREESMTPGMDKPTTMTSADYLQPPEWRLRDIDKSSVLDDLMEIITEEELQNMWP